METETTKRDEAGTKPVGFWEAFWFWVKLGFINSYTHPKYCIAAECAPPGRPDIAGNRPRYDVGVAVLDRPVRMSTYGALPDAGLVNTLKEGQRLTTVGYGANGFEIGAGSPPQIQPFVLDDRHKATVRLLDTKNPDVGDMFVKTTGVNLTGARENPPVTGIRADRYSCPTSRP